MTFACVCWRKLIQECQVSNFFFRAPKSLPAIETLVQFLNSPFFSPHIGAEPGRAKRRDSHFARPGSASICGGKKGEFGDWTIETRVWMRWNKIKKGRTGGFSGRVHKQKNRLLHRKCAVRIFIHESQNFRNERVSVANE